MNFLKIIFFLIIIINPLKSYCADNSVIASIDSDNKIYELKKQWYFTTNDDLSNKDNDIDLTSWDRIYHQFSWVDLPKYKDYKGYGWYRADINIPTRISNLSLFIPFHYRGAQIFFNGKLVHQTRKFDTNNESQPIVGKPDCIIIPDKLLKIGKNTITIRTGWLDHNAGFYGIIEVGTYNSLHKKWLIKTLWYYILSALNLFLTLFFIILFRKRKNEKYYIYFSCLAFTLGLWIIGFKGRILWIFDYQIIYLIFTYLCAVFVPILLLKFLHNFLNIREYLVTKIFKIGFWIFALLLILNYMIYGNIAIFQKYFYKPFILNTLIIFIYSVFLSIKGVKSGRTYAKRILAGISILTLSFIFSAFNFLSIFSNEPLLIEGYFGMTFVFASVLASRFAQVHNDLEKAHGDLLVVDKMKDDFIATVSHELKTPLHGIIGISESLSMEDIGRLNSNQSKNVDIILESARHLSRLVNDILDFSKVKNNKVDLLLTRLKPESIIDPVASLIRVLIDKKEIKLTVEIDKLPEIMADKNRIQQVLINLTENAVKFTDSGEIKISAVHMNNHIQISVSDTGIGINPEHFQQIWTPFKQVEDTSIRSYSGVGLGLAICKELVEMHKGEIWVDGEQGSGATFHFTLPIDLDLGAIYTKEELERHEKNMAAYNQRIKKNLVSEVSTNLSASKGTKKSNGMKILVVDDDLTNLQIILNMCKPMGYKAITCRNGFEALDIIKKNPPDLILLDLMLPKMSGYEVCVKIREKADKLTIPVIMLTARTQLEDLVAGFNSGANDYLTKPFDRHELIARIENQLTIRELFKAEKNLQNVLNIYKYIVSTTREHMCFIDKKSEFKAINNAFLKAVSLKLPDILDHNLESFVNQGGFWKSLEEYFNRCISGEEIYTINWYSFPDSGRIPFEISMNPYRDEDGNITGVVMNSRDISNQIQLEQEISNISESERRQIGMELHDGLCQHLLGVILQSRILSDSQKEVSPETSNNIRNIEKSIKEAVEMTRNLAKGLFPVGLDNKRLKNLLDSFKQAFEKSNDIIIEVLDDSQITVINLDILTHLYYIIQEALRNIIKHSNAETIRISTSSHEDMVEILIHNDGDPYSKDAYKTYSSDIASGGMGLSIMRYRARLIGGSVEVKAAEKQGTDFICFFKNLEN